MRLVKGNVDEAEAEVRAGIPSPSLGLGADVSSDAMVADGDQMTESGTMCSEAEQRG